MYLLELNDANLDFKDPILLDWFLRRLKDLKGYDLNEAQAIEKKYFTPEAIQEILDSHHDFLIKSLVNTINPDFFLNHIEFLLKQWDSYGYLTSQKIVDILLPKSPEQTYLFFDQLISKTEEPENIDDRIIILKNLYKLPSDKQKILFQKILTQYLSQIEKDLMDYSEINSLSDSLRPLLVLNAFYFQDPHTKQYFHDFIRYWDESLNQLVSFYQDLAEKLFDSLAHFNLLDNILEDHDDYDFSLLKDFYIDETPIEEINSVIEGLLNEQWDDLTSFYQRFKWRLEENPYYSIVESIVNDSFILGDMHEDHLQCFCEFLMSAIIKSYEIEKLDVENRSLKEVIEWYSSLDLLEIPHYNDFRAYFLQQDPDELESLMIEKIESAKSLTGSERINILQLMSEWTRESSIPYLIEGLIDNDEYISEISNKTIMKYGKLAEKPLLAELSKVSDEHYFSIINLLINVGGKETCQYMLDHYDRFWQWDKIEFLELVKMLPDPRFIPKLENKILKNQFNLDEAYYILQRVNHIENPVLDQIKKEIIKGRQSESNFIQDFKSGKILTEKREFLSLDLKCSNCGDESFYDVYKIFINLEEKNHEPYIADEICCLNCNQISEFELTKKGTIAIRGEQFRMMMIDQSTEKNIQEISDDSPIQFVRLASRRKNKTIGKGVKEYKKNIQLFPDNPENYIGLANIYNNLKLDSQALEYFKKALSINPDYIQCYFSISSIEEDNGNLKKAWQWLDKGKEYLNKSLNFNLYHLSISDLKQGFVEKYNYLSGTLGYNELLEDYSPISAKPGRNDPCSCGSGKKYKKCCGK